MELLTKQRITRLKEYLIPLKELLIHQHTQLQEQKKEHEVYTRAEIQKQELLKFRDARTQKIAEIIERTDKAEHDLTRLHADISIEKVLLETLQQENTHQLTNNAECTEIQSTLNTIAAEITIIEHALVAVQRNNPFERLNSLNAQYQEIQTVQTEIAQQHDKIMLFGRTKQLLRATQHELQKTAKALHEKEILISSLTTRLHEVKDAELKRSEHAEKKQLLLIEMARLDQALVQQKELRAKAQLLQEQIKELRILIDEHQTLAEAFGKDGIQALLIEDALPEIEQEANYLLAQLTNNQAHISIESLRDLKRGGTKETLDINISDALGVRPYELFSGGEAFRIDFALRIAIAKLLARRAGSSLQTLIIDEGFGSQDEEGLSLLMEGIHKIQDNFAKVIIVSHLPAMKEQFPVHFMVHKGPGGSSVQAIVQG